MKILVVAAHPDDEVLGCGGTIKRLSQGGHDIYIAILGEGITSRYEKQEQVDETLVKNLHNCSHKVAELLGARDLFMYNLPDNRFDTVPLIEIVKIVEGLINRLNPEVIYTHFNGDLNIDHMMVHRAVLTATRPIAGHPVKEIYAFEVPSSTEWAFGQFDHGFHANVFVDITDTLDVKLKAMQTYESEVRTFPYPRSPEAIWALAQLRGSSVGLRAAEAFELIRYLRT